ncbi:hypothetical protein LguiB_005505 [Lonicera macranthoides]
MEVQLISTETIKPSSPTPPHLQTFKASIIDKVLPHGYIQFISFYVPNQNFTKQTSIQHLKQSLSQTLTIFYPFAGRVKDNLTVDCNDDGVLFTTAHVSCKMCDLLANPKPKPELFGQFATPVPPFSPGLADRPAQIAIQVNQFDCGGIALFFSLYHFIIDAATIGMFLKCWSQIASKNECMSSSICPAVSMYPQGSEESMPDGLSAMIVFSLLKEGRGTTKRFVFDGSAISALKEKTKSEAVPNPSRVEAVSCFMWKHLMATSEAVWGFKQPSILLHAADLRRRMAPAVSSELSVGNIIWNSIARYDITTNNDVEVEKQLMVLEREAIEKIKYEFVPKLQSNGGYATIREAIEELHKICSDKSLNPYIISSWCKTGLDEVDFGWGKPVWVSFMPGIDVPFKNVAILIDGETNEKIEAWITLDHREMTVLERDHEFLAFASLNPPLPFLIGVRLNLSSLDILESGDKDAILHSLQDISEGEPSFWSLDDPRGAGKELEKIEKKREIKATLDGDFRGSVGLKTTICIASSTDLRR